MKAVRKGKYAQQSCSIARAAAIVADPWTLLILREAFAGNRRFADFVEFTGAQPSVVSDRLKSLVEVGVLDRREYQEHPPRQEYRLTEMGLDLYPLLLVLTKWGNQYLDQGQGAPIIHTHKECGEPADPTLHCGHCAQPIDHTTVRASIGPGADPDDIERRKARRAQR